MIKFFILKNYCTNLTFGPLKQYWPTLVGHLLSKTIQKKTNNFTYRMAGFLRSKAVIRWGQRKIARERKEAVSFG